jgi:hypothetical protein
MTAPIVHSMARSRSRMLFFVNIDQQISTPILHCMPVARSGMLCFDIHHYVGCSDSLGIKMLGAADPVAAEAAAVSAAAQTMVAACTPREKSQPAASGVWTVIAVVLRADKVILPNCCASLPAM